MEPLQELLELEALRRLKGLYFLYLDTKQWDLWLGLFTADATLKWDTAASTKNRDGQSMPMQRGIDAIREHVVNAILDPARTVHQGHTPILDLVSETEARGIWAMEDIVDSPERSIYLRAYGHYHETYRKVSGSWKIASLHLTRLRVELTSN